MSELKLLEFKKKEKGEGEVSRLKESLIICPANVPIILQNQNRGEAKAPGGGKITTIITENHKFLFEEDCFLIPSSQMDDLFEGFDFQLLELKKGGDLGGEEEPKTS